MSDINELVEWVAEFIYIDNRKHMITIPEYSIPVWFELDTRRKDRYRKLAKQILSNPQIVFLEDDQSFDYTSIGYSVTNHEIIQAMLKAGFKKVKTIGEKS